MAGLLRAAGHELVENEDDADVVLFNTCTVKTPSENTFVHRLNKVKRKSDKKIIIGGCVPQADARRFSGFSLIGTRQLDHVVEVVERTLGGETVQLLQRTEKPSLSVPKVRRNPLVETIPISLGCMSYCTFCKTKLARGALSSYPLDEIVDKVRRVTSEGVRELWLTSQDAGCYGFDIDTNVAVLLRELVAVGKDFKIRLGMANPDHILKIKDKLIDVFLHEKVFKFLHIPVQAGHNDVLRGMKRTYTVEQFREIVSAFRACIPDITFATDIICGFPGETEEQFMDTVRLLREVQPDVVNISRFWARPGTAAARMEQLPVNEIKRRSGIIAEEFAAIARARNERWIGWEGEILIDEVGKDGTWIGRNFAYKPVVVSGDFKLGDMVNVKIERATKYCLYGVDV